MLLPIFLVQALLFQLAVGQHANFDDLDPNDEMSEDEFEKYYHKEKPSDSKEYEKFKKGESTWSEKVNEFSDLPDDEFKKQRTGALNGKGRGLLRPDPENMVDADSELFFAAVRMTRGSAPDSYSSVDEGLVSGVKNQDTCGSCVAFSTAAAVETCFMKQTGRLGDVPEQEFVDCGYGQEGAAGCNGAQIYSYGKYWADNSKTLSHESLYAYKDTDTDYTCSNLDEYKMGAQITNNYYTYSGDEESLKELVYTYGAVVSTVQAEGDFSDYSSGVFAGCSGSATDHAITVVGYGTEDGVDYWLIKNSWGTSWGEDGYIKLKRGVNMCGIGTEYSVPICTTVTGATDSPLTTAKPCTDNYSNCATLAESNCQNSCGLCDGMTPASSYTCYDMYSNCADYSSYCSYDSIKNYCKITCGSC